jgi:hypothetical protein
MRQVAHFCVTLATEKTRKSLLFDSFLTENRWSNRRDREKARWCKGLGGVYRCCKSDASWRILSARRPPGNSRRGLKKSPELPAFSPPGPQIRQTIETLPGNSRILFPEPKAGAGAPEVRTEAP